MPIHIRNSEAERLARDLSAMTSSLAGEGWGGGAATRAPVSGSRSAVWLRPGAAGPSGTLASVLRSGGSGCASAARPSGR